MKVLIDTNVILDVLLKRESHFEFSASVLKLCGMQVTGFIAANQTTDIFYLLRRGGKDAKSAKDIVKMLIDNVKVLDISAADVQNAIADEALDYEDSLLACCAERHKADYIITRNEKDFNFSQVPALSPQTFLKQFFGA